MATSKRTFNCSPLTLKKRGLSLRTSASRKKFLQACLPEGLVGVFNGPIPPRGPHQAYALLDRVHWPLPDPVVSLFKIQARTQADAHLPSLARALVSLLGEKLGPRGLAEPIRVDQGWEQLPYGYTRYLLQSHAVAIFDLPYYSTWWLDISFSGTLILIPSHRDSERRLFPHLPVYLEPGADVAAIAAHLLKTNQVAKLTLAQQAHLSWKLQKILARDYSKTGSKQ